MVTPLVHERPPVSFVLLPFITCIHKEPVEWCCMYSGLRRLRVAGLLYRYDRHCPCRTSRMLLSTVAILPRVRAVLRDACQVPVCICVHASMWQTCYLNNHACSFAHGNARAKLLNI